MKRARPRSCVSLLAVGVGREVAAHRNQLSTSSAEKFAKRVAPREQAPATTMLALRASSELSEAQLVIEMSPERRAGPGRVGRRLKVDERISAITMPNGNTNNRKRRRAPCLRPALVIVVFIGLAASRLVAPTSAQCPRGTLTSFERTSGVNIKDSQLVILYQANLSQATIGHHSGGGGNGAPISTAGATTTTTLYQISTPITAECNNRCRNNASCRAFLVDYGRHACWSVQRQNASSSSSSSSSSSQAQVQELAFSLLERTPTPIQLVFTGERTAYFEKVCHNALQPAPKVPCERAWHFERVLAHHILGNDDKIIDEVPSRLRCQEHCLHERQFRCRSGEYDHSSLQCRLSLVDRHLRPNLFRPAASSSLDYFENQCAQDTNQCDQFDRFEDMDLGRAEIMRLANTSDQCQQFCTQTIKAFVCRSFTWSPLTSRCYLNSANTLMVGGLDRLLAAPGLVYFQRNDCVDLKLECDTNSMTLNLRTNEPFRGRMYVRDEPNSCESLGRSALLSSLTIPFQASQLGGRCAQRELSSRYSSVVVVQQHPLIQRKSDRYIKLVCDFQTSNKTIMSHYNVMANPWTSTALINATSFAPKIALRITDKFGKDIAGAKLGDELQLRIEAESDSVYDMVARSVLAKSGTTDESIVLIDRDGCPADYRIFPPLKKLSKRVIIGRFDAFKFATDVVVRFQVDVQFCLNSCPPTSCLEQQQQQQQQQQNAQLFNLNPAQLSGSGGGSGSGPAQVSGAMSNSLAGGPEEEAVGNQQTAAAATSGGSLMAPTNSPALSNSEAGVRNSAPPPPPHPVGEYIRSTTYAPLQSAPQPDYLAGPLNLASSAQYSGQQQPAVNQPLPAGQQQQQSFGSDQLFDSSQPRSMPLGEPAAAGGKRAKLPQQQNHNRHHQNNHQNEDNSPLLNANQLDQLSGPELAAALNRAQQQQDQNSHRSRRRRRRSAELLPPSPQHVPLGLSIIVTESPGGGQPAKAKGDAAEPAKGLQTGRRGQRDMKAGKLAARQQHRHEGLSMEGAKYELNPAEQAATLAAGPEESRAQLVCTTRASLVFALLAFGALQLLTLAACLTGWLYKRRRASTGKRPNSAATPSSLVGHTFEQPRGRPSMMHGAQIQAGQRLF